MPEVVEKLPDVYQYILTEEAKYRTERVPLASNWRDWNMYEHVDRSFQLKNSKFYLGSQDFTRPFVNIILPIANVNYRTEGFDVKDAEIYVDSSENYHKSFLARKFHNWWAIENKIDTAIDESVESYFDYGLALLKNFNEARPEVVQLQQIAFCDQSDVMAGPICLRHYYSIPELLAMEGRWDKDAISKAVLMARTKKNVDQADDDQLNTPGKYLEVYELHGIFPESWLGKEKLGSEWEDTGRYVPQLHIITYYQSEGEQTKRGITLFRGREPKPVFKALKRDPIFGRACGRGGIEELFQPQIWANWSTIQIKDILAAVADMVWVTNDKKFANQKISNLKKGQVLHLDDGKDLVPKQMSAASKIPFDQFFTMLEQNARAIGSASDPQLGKNPVSGTPLGTVEIVTAQGQGIHEYRQGKIADFWVEIYRDWVLPHLSREINKGSRWLDELALDELQDVAERVATSKTNKRIKEMTLAGKMLTRQEMDTFKSVVREEFAKGGEKRFLEIVKDEFKDLAMDVKISIAGKQEALFETVAKLNSVFRAIFNPAGMQALQADPAAQKLLNEILEKSGLNPINFAGQPVKPAPVQETSVVPEEVPVNA